MFGNCSIYKFLRSFLIAIGLLYTVVCLSTGYSSPQRENFIKKYAFYQSKGKKDSIRHLLLTTGYKNLSSLDTLKINYLIAKDFYLNGSFDTACSYLEKKPRLTLSDSSASILINYYNLYGTICYILQKHNKAKDLLIKGIYIAKKFKAEEDLPMLFNNIALVYRKNGALSKAIDSYKNALSYPIPNVHDKVRIKINLCALYSAIGDINTASKSYNELKIYIKKIHGSKLLYDYLLNFGILCIKKGDYNEALDYFTYAKNFSSSDDPYKQNNLLNHIGLCHYYLKDYKKSLYCFNKIIEESNNEILKELAHNNLSLCYSTLKDYKKAEKHLLAALVNSQKNKKNLAGKYLNFANLKFKQKNYFKSLDYLYKCLTLINNSDIKDKDLGIKAYYLLTKIYERKRMFKKALNFCNLSINANMEPDKLVGQASVYSEILYLQSIKKKANLYSQIAEKQTNVDSCIITYKKSLSLLKKATKNIQKLRVSYFRESTKLFLSENEKPTYTEGVEVCFNLFRLTNNKQYIDDAFYFIEQSKSPTLLNNIKEVEARIAAHIPDSLLTAEKTITAKIAAYKQLIYQEKDLETPNNKKIAQWEQQIFRLHSSWENFIKQIEADFPNYFNLKYNYTPISLKAFQKELTSDRVFIHYLINNDILYRLIITKNKKCFFENKLESSFYEALNDYRFFLTNPQNAFDKECFKSFTEASSDLYDLLIKNKAMSFENKKVTFIPDEELGFIPFETLLKKNKEIPYPDYSRLDYAIKSFAISYAYSATLLRMKIHDFNKSKDLLAMAPKYPKSQINKYSMLFRDEKLQALEATKDEVNNISKYFSGDIMFQNEANASNFKKLSKDYKILHLAMHSVMDSLDFNFSSLAFTNSKNNYLSNIEIKAMEIKAPLVVLSACNTGIGPLRKGEGIMSLARSFKYAGCPCIVMTLWDIADQTSAQLMSYFYDYLAQNYSKDVSLQKVKLKYLKTCDPLKAHPYYWAGYVSIGNNSPMKHIPPLLASLVWLIIIIFLMGLTTFFFFRKNY